ncbi:MAG: hypothetical protein AB3A66_10420 [Nodularia sp. CChRGM 3473]
MTQYFRTMVKAPPEVKRNLLIGRRSIPQRHLTPVRSSRETRPPQWLPLVGGLLTQHSALSTQHSSWCPWAVTIFA